MEPDGTCKAIEGNTRHCEASQGNAKNSMAMQGNARQGKARLSTAKHSILTICEEAGRKNLGERANDLAGFVPLTDKARARDLVADGRKTE